MNKCIFLGRLTKDVEVKYVGTDNTAVANFTLAVDRRFKKEGQPTADFLNFVALGKTADIIGKYCVKGSQISVSSRVQTRTWEDKDGNKHYTTEFVVEEFSFAGSKATGDNKPVNSASSDDENDEEPFVL